jgi:hypothetical protein
MGRPPLPPEQRRAHSLRMTLTSGEREAVERAAQEAGLSLSDYCRAAVLRALRRAKGGQR